MADYAFFCANAYMGQDGRNPFLNTIGAQPLFCLSKLPGGTTYGPISEHEGRERLRHASEAQDRHEPRAHGLAAEQARLRRRR